MHLLHVYGFIIFLYVTVRLIVPSPLPFRGKLVCTILALGASQYHYLIRNYFGSLSSPEMPYPLLVLASFSFILITLLFAVLVVRDVALLLLFFIRRGHPVFVPFSPGRRALFIAGLGLALGARGYCQAVRPPEVRTTEITLDRLPPELDGLVIAQITDLHAAALLNAPRVAEVVARTNAMRPDIIVLTGDLVDGSTARRAADVAPLRDLKARYGIFACEGNHEYYSGHASWMRAFAAMGLPHMHNSHTVVTIRGRRLVLAGVNDPVGGSRGNGGPDVETALAGAPRDAPVILLAHRPEFARHNAERGVDLQLSGHTHGGQMLGFDRIVASRNGGFLRGLYSVGAMRLYVCSGSGLWSGFPVRLGVPSEIARIVLRSGRAV